MQKTETRQAETHYKEPKTVQGLLLSALDMEDEIAHSVYRDYLDRENWPADLKDDIFEEIQKYLTTLLEPVIILIMGLIVGITIIAILTPLFELSGIFYNIIILNDLTCQGIKIGIIRKIIAMRSTHIRVIK